jgi:hypothetical protein
MRPLEISTVTAGTATPASTSMIETFHTTKRASAGACVEISSSSAAVILSIINFQRGYPTRSRVSRSMRQARRAG